MLALLSKSSPNLGFSGKVIIMIKITETLIAIAISTNSTGPVQMVQASASNKGEFTFLLDGFDQLIKLFICAVHFSKQCAVN